MAGKGLFIAFEGIDGSGKSTQVKLLAEKFIAGGYPVYATCEPTDGPIGKLIRTILKGESTADERTIAALFAADRLEHLLNKVNGIAQKIEEGYVVITDRYYFSSYAYNGTHTPLQWVIAANSLSAGILKPDLHIFIDVSPEVSMHRISKNRNSKELYETAENLKNVRQKYFETFELLKHQEKIAIVDGNRSPEVIAEDIWKAVSEITLPAKTV
jgi:dTMP kinase